MSKILERLKKLNQPKVDSFSDNFKHNIDIISQAQKIMPDFRKLAMGIQGQVDIIGVPVDDEIPSPTVDGSTTAFTLTYTPKEGSVKVYLNGTRKKGGGEDYTLSGNTITFNTAPRSIAILLVDYKR